LRKIDGWQKIAWITERRSGMRSHRLQSFVVVLFSALVIGAACFANPER
jgi:hypothetical protein